MEDGGIEACEGGGGGSVEISGPVPRTFLEAKYRSTAKSVVFLTLLILSGFSSFNIVNFLATFNSTVALQNLQQAKKAVFLRA